MYNTFLFPLRYSPLHEEHLRLQGKMIPFAGWILPREYSSPLQEHKSVRERVGVFDVSHMGRVVLYGEGVEDLLLEVTPSSIDALQDGEGKYTVFLNERGGIVDDCIVYKLDPHQYLIVWNAGNHEKNLRYISPFLSRFSVTLRDETSQTVLLAVQGPKALSLVSDLLSFPVPEKRFSFVMASFRSTTLFILRTGYTGEDGVEIWADRSVGLTLFQTILQGGAVPCGLASRDTLRIEAGYPLYGHELSEETTPYEGGIGFVVKRKEGFLGAEVLRKFSLNSSFLTIRGIISEEKVPPREGYPLFGKDGKEVGKVTSGGFSPIIQGGIGLARIPNTIEEGTTLFMEVRGARRPVRVLHPPLHKEGRKISNHP